MKYITTEWCKFHSKNHRKINIIGATIIATYCMSCPCLALTDFLGVHSDLADSLIM